MDPLSPASVSPRGAPRAGEAVAGPAPVNDDRVDEGGQDGGDVDVDREVDALGYGAGDDLPGPENAVFGC